MYPRRIHRRRTGVAGSLDCRASRPEVRRHLGGRPRSHPGRGRSRRADPAGRRRRRGRGVGDGQVDRRSAAARARRRRASRRARARHAADRGRADLDGAGVHGDGEPRRTRDVVHRVAGRASSPTPSTTGPRSSRSRATASARRSPAGKVAIVAGFQGVSTTREITTLGRGASDLTAVALGRRARAPTCARSTPTSRACTPPIRAIVPQGAQAAPRLVRRDARDGRDRRPRARAAISRVRAQPRRAGACSFELHLGAGHLGHRGGSVVDFDGAGDNLGRHARRVRGQGHDRAGARPAGRRGHVVPRARRRRA